MALTFSHMFRPFSSYEDDLIAEVHPVYIKASKIKIDTLACTLAIAININQKYQIQVLISCLIDVNYLQKYINICILM